MSERFYFICYSRRDDEGIALTLADQLAAGPPSIPVWLDRRNLQPGIDWDEQIVGALRGSAGVLYVMTKDSVSPNSECKREWTRGLKYNKAIIPLLFHKEAEMPFRLEPRQYIDFTHGFDAGLARLREHVRWRATPEGVLHTLKERLEDAHRDLARGEEAEKARIEEEIAELKRQCGHQIGRLVAEGQDLRGFETQDRLAPSGRRVKPRDGGLRSTRLPGRRTPQQASRSRSCSCPSARGPPRRTVPHLAAVDPSPAVHRDVGICGRRRGRHTSDLKRFIPRQRQKVLGFEPRFTNSEWARLLHGHAPSGNANIKMALSSTYADFADAFESEVESASPRVLIVDLAIVPDALKSLRIVELSKERLGLDFEELVRAQVEAQGLCIDSATLRVMRAMCTGADGTTVGALPLWLNWHGRFFSEESNRDVSARSLASVTSLRGLFSRPDAKVRLAEAGVQIARVSSAAFEFWAHLAYRDCRLFITDPTSNRIRTSLDEFGPTFDGLVAAAADVAVRLRHSEMTAETFGRATFPLDLAAPPWEEMHHADDARAMRDGAVNWKPVFSSELLSRTLRRGTTPADFDAALADEVRFKPPYARRLATDRWTYLSALGGYGVALGLPAGCSDHDAIGDAVRALLYVFHVNPRLVHPYLSEAVSELSQAHLVDFVQLHARPRWPFWREAERHLTQLIYSLLLIVNRLPDTSPASYWDSCVETLKHESAAREAVFRFLKKTGELAHAHCWSLDRTSGDLRKTVNPQPVRPDKTG